MTPDNPQEGTWVEPTHQAFIDAGIGIVGYVPDGGLRDLITRLDGDGRIRTVRLTSEEEGVALATGAWLGGSRAAILMQSSGVGNCTNMLSLLTTCAVPALILVTMRGQQGEANPWQRPMGEAAGPSLELMGVQVYAATSAEAVAPTVSRACVASFECGGPAAAVLVSQSVVGVKSFAGDDQ